MLFCICKHHYYIITYFLNFWISSIICVNSLLTNTSSSKVIVSYKSHFPTESSSAMKTSVRFVCDNMSLSAFRSRSCYSAFNGKDQRRIVRRCWLKMATILLVFRNHCCCQPRPPFRIDRKKTSFTKRSFISGSYYLPSIRWLKISSILKRARISSWWESVQRKCQIVFICSVCNCPKDLRGFVPFHSAVRLWLDVRSLTIVTCVKQIRRKLWFNRLTSLLYFSTVKPLSCANVTLVASWRHFM